MVLSTLYNFNQSGMNIEGKLQFEEGTPAHFSLGIVKSADGLA
jgi:hypothetical protein